MELLFKILRKKAEEEKQYWQTFFYTGLEENDTVATALRKINEDTDVRDEKGNPVEKIIWESSCLQKKCGACAMRINGKPRLACDSQLIELGDVIRLEPLRKFPLVADLMVDRQTMFDNLRGMKAWLNREVSLDEKVNEIAYDASCCLQCGCCLEVCPNFAVNGKFSGTAAMVPFNRLLSELPKRKKEELYGIYTGRIYEGCGKSLACRDVCPAGIDVEKMLINSNGIAVDRKSVV